MGRLDVRDGCGERHSGEAYQEGLPKGHTKRKYKRGIAESVYYKEIPRGHTERA